MDTMDHPVERERRDREKILIIMPAIQRGYSEEKLSSTFSIATIGNGLVAIVAGLIASFASDRWGYVAPFMVP